jgi:GDP-L-fucose synthase
LAEAGIDPSVGSRGDSYDNALAETINGLYKAEVTDDLADACLYLMRNYEDEEFVNIGVGADISIAELAQLVKEIVGFEGDVVQDTTKPDGAPRKLLDVSRLYGLGWRARIPLREGIEQTYRWFLENMESYRD